MRFARATISAMASAFGRQPIATKVKSSSVIQSLITARDQRSRTRLSSFFEQIAVRMPRARR